MPKVGDDVVTVEPLWHHGEDVGGRLGQVISTTSYIVVNLYDYHDNPIKCFRHEVSVVQRPENSGWDFDPDDEDTFDTLFGGLLGSNNP